jgi:hypothetical protein
MYSLMEAQQFSTAIFGSPDDDHIGRNMQRTSDVKSNFEIKKRKRKKKRRFVTCNDMPQYNITKNYICLITVSYIPRKHFKLLPLLEAK